MIKIEHMSKSYGPYPAVIDISFEVLKGEIVGFLGPNGAGKTTTMRVVTGFTPPTHGDVTVGGYDVVSHSLDVRRHIGYLPESVPLYLDMTVTDYLTYMGEIRGMNKSWVKERLPKVIEMVRLGEYRNTLVGRLSKGYRQRTGIAQAILHEPDVLVMDEPTIGIDPIQVVETRELISNLGEEHTMLLSSHILPEVSAICKRVLVINDGRIVADDKPDDLSEKLQHAERIEISVRGAESPAFINAMRDISDVVDARSDQRASIVQRAEREDFSPFIVDARPNVQAAEQIAKTIIENGWGLTNLTPLPMTLEEIFLELTTEENLGE
ncbi:ABC transporter ATP-binding protein [Candidatus Lucifugimonas marina]|uniref:ATP-binding cassette domain-containing protein n=2 Tax=Candidatus Lucifugimonas marina TaxID=3038979 RepID=A0ABD4XMB8_9CHLR|nr:ATP-binding cassette domain-containing protein [SAR202 cluster bacterium JH702]MDG0868947.1 ATP-binding cassette domain-containing protein [SAR202 cluster bacterium JH639]WFG35574.1 ATP-binding cassette domain-containing protein [SAR202 cluster bacterium JH545]